MRETLKAEVRAVQRLLLVSRFQDSTITARSETLQVRLSPMSMPSGGSWNDCTSAPGSFQQGQSLSQRSGSVDEHSGMDPTLYTCPLPASTMIMFQLMAEQCGLEGKYRGFAMAQAEVYGENNRHLAQATAQALILKELSRVNGKIDSLTESLGNVTRMVIELTTARNQLHLAARPDTALASNSPSQNKEWTPSSTLIDMITPLALKLVFSPLIHSYTAVKNKPEGYLANSLFNTIKEQVSKEGPLFASLHLPPLYGGVESSADAQSYASVIRDSGKKAREKLHNTLLTGIHDPKTSERVDIPVPSIKNLMQQVAMRCGTARKKAAVEAVWIATDLPTRGRIAYLRREAARLVMKGGKGCESIWAVVDNQLSLMRQLKDQDYETAFYQIVYDEDCDLFDDKNWFKDLRERKINLDLPSEEAIRGRIPGGGGVNEPEVSNTGSQNIPHL
ncbi:hypothetical protein DFH28DRAFT_1084902 [Melampsora americana]|nr:hypothetical protein DFH28DRAFT_1084902 [Melampsora americana]